MNFDESSRLYPDRGAGRSSFPVTTALEKVLIVITSISMIIVIGLVICLIGIKKTSNEFQKELRLKDESICVSAACVTEASNLMKSLDLSVDPCTDFYSFVCKNWIKNHHLVSSRETQFTELTRTIILRVKEILEDLQKEKDLPENKKKTSDFYKACTDEVHREFVDAKELLLDLKKFGGWPIIEEEWDNNFDWADLMIQLFENGYTSNMLFSIKVDVDVKNTSRSLITVREPSLGLRKREYYLLPYEKLLKSYKYAICKLAQYLDSDIDQVRCMREIEEAFRIEDKLAHISKELDIRNAGEYYIDTLENLEISTPMIQWRKILRRILPPGTELKNEEPIIFHSQTMLKELNYLLKELDNPQGKRVLANYMFYRVVFNAANHLSKKFYLLTTNLLDIHAPLWETCTKLTMELFQFPVTASYAAKYTDNNTKEELGEMFEDMRHSLMNDIRNSKWLDDETKNYALLKAAKMKAAIAYEDEIMDDDNLDAYYKGINITENHFGNVKRMVAFKLKRRMKGLHEKRTRFKWTELENLLTANAYYWPSENSIIIPVGVLQDTVFATGRPSYVNYGSLGMIVGHELTHAFDSIGSFYDAEGSYRMWWSNSSWKKFEERMKCYEEQYDNYYCPIAHSYVNGTLTLAENIADNGGLRTAYYAYKTVLKRKASEQSLPGLPYNEKQMFWISFASVWCRKQTEDSIKSTLTNSVHTPAQFRVIGSLSNMKEFSEDFNCKLNTTMNPTTRCYLWE